MIQTEGKDILIFDTSLDEAAFPEEEFDDEE
jgi:CRP/FNR family cyclic AMP-dependent transcriptional regulator